MTDLSNIDVVILCGGLGKRLMPVVSDKPKVLAKIGDRAFLDIVMDRLVLNGFKKIILSVGYMKEMVKEHIINCHYNNISIRFSEETEPLGTGGAVKNTEPLITSSPFIVMNGDSICNLDFRDFFDFHLNKRALLSMVLVRSEMTIDYGTVVLDSTQRVTGFKEKVSGCGTLINAGIYLMGRDVFLHMPGQDRFSLEYDLFPNIVGNRCFGYLTDGDLIDIGTLERYEKAVGLLGHL